MRWVTSTLGEICDNGNGFVRTGPFGSQLHEADYQGEGLPVVMPKDIISGKIVTETIARIGKEDEDRLKQHKLLEGDIVYGRRGDIGRRALITEREDGWLCGTGCLRIHLGQSDLDPKFLYYYLGQQHIVEWIAKRAIGATLPNLNTSILRSVTICYPEGIANQVRISEILSAYDDLIENNLRRIKLLEQAARDLYQEWFVHLRFPGHEDVKIETDTIPAGWKRKSLGEVAFQKRESIQPAEVEPDTPYVGLEHIPRRSIALHEWGKASDVVSTKLTFQADDILFGKIRPYFHKVVIAPIAGVTSSDTIVIAPREKRLLPLILMCVSSDDFVAHATQTSQGTKMPRADWNILTNYPVLIPEDEVLEEFGAIVSNMTCLIQNMVFRNAILRQQRDLLLPRLISGELDVSNLDIPVSEELPEATNGA